MGSLRPGAAAGLDCRWLRGGPRLPRRLCCTGRLADRGGVPRLEGPERPTWIIGAMHLTLIHIYFFLLSDLGYSCLVVEVGQVEVGCMTILPFRLVCW